MIRRAVCVMVLGLLIGSCSPALAEGNSGPARDDLVPAAYLAGTESRLITSSNTGRTYQVSVALPRGYEDSSGTYPVLYSLDANGEFGTVVETARHLRLEQLAPGLVVVGVGYPVGHYFDAIGERALDLTVTEDSQWEDAVVARTAFPPPEGSGGAPGFLRFLIDELVPLIDAEYRVDQEDRALFGHSFGGLFAFHALLHGQGTFQRFIVASPAFWWDDRVSFDHEATYAAANRSLNARAFFSVGMLELDAASDGVPWRYITNLRDLSAILEDRSYDGFEWTMHFFDDEHHTSVVPASVSRGLRYIYAAN